MTEFENQLIIDNLDLVDKVIRSRIHLRSTSVLMTFEDLQGVGREALCRAALRYKPQLGAFAPFASRCIYNALIDHCKNENAIGRATSDCEDDELHEAAAERAFAYSPDYESIIDSLTAEQILARLKQQYTGVVKLGIEAIELKLLGVRSSEIAARYGTTVNNVNAWISKARKKLQTEETFLNAIF
jgi:RNA polymerase sigma factor (sigma-70 family)